MTTQLTELISKCQDVEEKSDKYAEIVEVLLCALQEIQKVAIGTGLEFTATDAISKAAALISDNEPTKEIL